MDARVCARVLAAGMTAGGRPGGGRKGDRHKVGVGAQQVGNLMKEGRT